ncbi:MAG: hypothetical protein JXK16_07530 [Thiotrichales bacterium]|nr:hypothetical protein [Thiotrichales bacterium]
MDCRVAGAPRNDKSLTKAIEEALGLVDIRTLDHLVVASEGYRSLAQMGWL